jgi:hypothetical protein
MVDTGFYTQRVRSYLRKWALWWATTTSTWQFAELLHWFIESCWELPPAAIAAGLLQRQTTLLNTCSVSVCLDVA